MTSEIIVAIIAFLGTLLGTFSGILTSSKLTNFRITALEQKVEKHNNLIERTYQLEGKVEELEHRVKALEDFDK